MKLRNLNLIDFLNKIDSADPTPGGGSAAALTTAVGISLVRMVSQITISKKKFKRLDDATKAEYLDATAELKTLKEEAMALIDTDAAAYLNVMNAYKMPKNTASEEKERLAAINMATVKAADVPYRTAEIALSALRSTKTLYPYAHKNAVSDIGVGIMQIRAGLFGACMNVRINMSGYNDQNLAARYLQKTAALEQEAIQISEVVLAFVNQNL